MAPPADAQCGACLYVDTVGDNALICRFNPPVPGAALVAGQVAEGPTLHAAAIWPQVAPTDWCSHFRKP